MKARHLFICLLFLGWSTGLSHTAVAGEDLKLPNGTVLEKAHFTSNSRNGNKMKIYYKEKGKQKTQEVSISDLPEPYKQRFTKEWDAARIKRRLVEKRPDYVKKLLGPPDTESDYSSGPYSSFWIYHGMKIKDKQTNRTYTTLHIDIYRTGVWNVTFAK